MNALVSLLLVVLAAPTEAPPSGGERNSANTLRLAAGATPPAASIEDVAWLAGYWSGPGLGGVSEELWSPPRGDRMYGVYTLRKEDALVFSEAMLLIETEGSLALRVKHFTPDFVGWEEKDKYVSFPLVRLGESEVYFSGLTLRRSGDLLAIYLVLSQNGERTEHEFRLSRGSLD